jgi:two-component system, cell cycle sensor histidine kinase and response regulator CckA
MKGPSRILQKPIAKKPKAKRKKTEEALWESEEKYRLIAENTADLISILDMNLRFTYVSPASLPLRGFTVREAMEQTLEQVLTPESMKRALAVFEKEIQQEASGVADPDRTRILELEEYKKDGSIVWMECSLSFLHDKKSRPFAILIVSRDITASKRDEEALKKSEARLIQAQAIARLGSWEIDLTNQLMWGSEEAFRIYGIPYPGDSSAFLPLADVQSAVHPEDRPRMDNALRALLRENNKYDEEFRIFRISDHALRIIHSRADVFVSDKRTPLKIFGTIQDITEHCKAEEERRSLEGRLQRAEKMEALGQLAGGVAHDLNNILGILSGYSELLLMEIPEGQRSRGHVEKILQSTEKGAAIIQDLLTLARRSVTASDIINLNGVVSDFLKTPVFEKMTDCHPRVTFRVECDKNLLNIKGSSVHLEKTLMNLVSNAAESISGKGEVTIRTENRYLDKTIRGYDEVREGDYAVLTVSDTGMGIPAENREKIFEPFYTKKTMGKRSGTGLGLAIVWGTVKDHHGYIDLQTKVGEGTTFTLYFPVTREVLIAPHQKEPIEQYLGKGESVLLVDDIAEQRDVASGLLRQLGYQVHVFSSGEEAVDYLKINKADILVLDMIMAPGIDGLETYKRILEINPKQKAILVSGFSQTDRVKEAQNLGAGAYVKKPYLMETIGIAIRDELNR